MFLYLIFICFLIFLFIRSRFWIRQPIQHFYNFHKGIISQKPFFNRFCDSSQVTTIQHQSIHEPTQLTIKSTKIQLHLDTLIPAYFSDMIVIEPTLFQTHIYNLHLTTNIGVHVFCTEKRLFWVVPLTHYKIQWVYTNTFTKQISMRKFFPATTNSLYTLLKTLQPPFPCQITPFIDDLTQSINKTLFVFYYCNPELIAIFIFKKTSILEWIATIRITGDPIEIPASSLICSLRQSFPIIHIHQNSHTPIYKGFKESERWVYIYNYGISTILPQKCLIL